VPKFRGPRDPSAPQPEVAEMRVALDDFAVEALRDEAARQGVAVEQLVAHAVSYYLADLDSGRITRRVLRHPER